MEVGQSPDGPPSTLIPHRPGRTRGHQHVASDRQTPEARLRATLAAVAPGTELREGLERVLRGRTGALVVLGNDRTVESLSTGGFDLDIEFTATALRELAKMDGAL